MSRAGITYDNFGRITSLPGEYAGGGTLTTSYYSNDMVASQSQGGITNTYELDSALRPRKRTQTGGSGGTEVFHYTGGSDSPAWTERGSAWTRNIAGIGGELAAIQDSAEGTNLQLTNLHGDIVATASLSPTATEPTAKFEFDEFGNPKSGASGRFGWLGGKQRRTELPSGVIQMGVRSYVPAMGRFISMDPEQGGSANSYDYVSADPLNSLDLEGTRARRYTGASASRGRARPGTGGQSMGLQERRGGANRKRKPHVPVAHVGPCSFTGGGVNVYRGDVNSLNVTITYSCTEESSVAGYLKIPVGYAGPRPIVGPIGSGNASLHGTVTLSTGRIKEMTGCFPSITAQ